MGSEGKPQITVNYVITAIIILGTIAQMFIQIALGKTLYRYFPIWLTLPARFFFLLRLRGYPSEHHLTMEAAGAGLGIFMFLAFNLQKAYVINWMQFIFISIIEIVVIIIMAIDKQMVYIIDHHDLVIVEEEREINRGE